MATAPAHVEDRLNDAWLQFAAEHPCGDTEAGQNLQRAEAILSSASGDGGSQQASLPSKEQRASEKSTRRPLKIAMEAMIRGFEKYSDAEEPNNGKDCSHTVAAWHNVPCP